jgi:hypothetical protein
VKVLKQQLLQTEAVLQEDFSENFTIKYQNEVQSAHWANHGITLFTAVLNTIDSTHSYVLVTDDLKHDKGAVACFKKIILEHAQGVIGQPIENLRIFTDGCVGQFKTRYTLSIVLTPEKLHQQIKKVDWSFFATSHGKGPVDGVGGTVKRAVWRRILRGQVVVNFAKDFADVATSACPGIHVHYVDAEEVASVRQERLDVWGDKAPGVMKGLRKHHFFTIGQQPGTLLMSRLSPFSGLSSPKVTARLFDSSELTVRPGSSRVDQDEVNSDDNEDVRGDIETEAYYAVDYINRF